MLSKPAKIKKLFKPYKNDRLPSLEHFQPQMHFTPAFSGVRCSKNRQRHMT